MKMHVRFLIPMIAVSVAIIPIVIAGEAPQPVAADDARLVAWASSAVIDRGPVDITVPDGALASYGSEADAVGAADAVPGDPFPVVSLGDGGVATLAFDPPIANGPGVDLVVFENAFDLAYLELAHVEVSSDGVHFYRFPSVSQTQVATQIGGFQANGIDTDDLVNLAGRFPAGQGTPFELEQLQDVSPWLNIGRITHVRVIDVVGSIDPAYGSRDGLGQLINDPWKTSFNTGGFDLDAVGACHLAPTTRSDWLAYHFPEGGETGDDQDPDLDGVKNLVEFALGSDPTRPSPVPLRMDRSGGAVSSTGTERGSGKA